MYSFLSQKFKEYNSILDIYIYFQLSFLSSSSIIFNIFKIHVIL